MHLASTPGAGRRRARRHGLAAGAAIAALWCLPAAASAAITSTTSPVDATLTTDTYALLGGIINPGGAATTYYFEWGPTAAYGQTTPVTPAGNGTADVPVDISLDTLKPSTTYHYRLVAQPAGGDPTTNVYGTDQTFKTAPALALQIVGRTAKVTKAGAAKVTLKVVGPTDGEAQGLLTVKALVAGKPQTLTVLPYDVPAGSRKTLSFQLPAAVRQALKAKGGGAPALKLSAKTTGIKAAVVKTLKLVG
jgi:hypothetical protein